MNQFEQCNRMPMINEDAPCFKAVTVKPWQRELLHKTLGIYEFDKYFDTYYERIK